MSVRKKDAFVVSTCPLVYPTGSSDADHHPGHLHPVLDAQHRLSGAPHIPDCGEEQHHLFLDQKGGTIRNVDRDPHHLRQQRHEPVSLRHLLSVRVSCLAFSTGSGLTESLTDFEKTILKNCGDDTNSDHVHPIPKPALIPSGPFPTQFNLINPILTPSNPNSSPSLLDLQKREHLNGKIRPLLILFCTIIMETSWIRVLIVVVDRQIRRGYLRALRCGRAGRREDKTQMTSATSRSTGEVSMSGLSKSGTEESAVTTKGV